MLWTTSEVTSDLDEAEPKPEQAQSTRERYIRLESETGQGIDWYYDTVRLGQVDV